MWNYRSDMDILELEVIKLQSNFFCLLRKEKQVKTAVCILRFGFGVYFGLKNLLWFVEVNSKISIFWKFFSSMVKIHMEAPNNVLEAWRIWIPILIIVVQYERKSWVHLVINRPKIFLVSHISSNKCFKRGLYLDTCIVRAIFNFDWNVLFE